MIHINIQIFVFSAYKVKLHFIVSVNFSSAFLIRVKFSVSIFNPYNKFCRHFFISKNPKNNVTRTKKCDFSKYMVVKYIIYLL